MREPSGVDRLLWLAQCVDAEIEAVGESFEDLDIEYVEGLLRAEERLQGSVNTLSKLLAGEQESDGTLRVGGMIASTDHPVFRALMAQIQKRRDRAAQIRRSHLRVVR